MNKFVVISGCSSGIGECVALALQQRGYRVIASVRKEEDKQKLLAQGLEFVEYLDLSDSASVQHFAQRVLNISEGKIYALFNNAAYGQPGAVEDLSREALRKQFEVNLFGTHELTCLLLPSMLAMPEARLIQNSSILGFIAMPMRGAYNASKHALEGLSDTLRMELRETNVKVSLIQPGPILTRFRANALRALAENLDYSRSRHKQRYEQALQRLSKEGAASKYTLPASALLKPLIHALEARHPRARYKVTFPTYLMAFLRPLLPTFMLDRILLGAAESRSG